MNDVVFVRISDTDVGAKADCHKERNFFSTLSFLLSIHAVGGSWWHAKMVGLMLMWIE